MTSARPSATGRAVACPRCRTEFSCGADQAIDDPCWCGSVPVPEATTCRLTVDYEGCLCPSCLQAEVALDTPAGSVEPGS